MIEPDGIASTAGPSRLRQATARGAVVNLGFGFVTQVLAAVQAVLVPRLIGPGDVGLFAIAMGGVGIGSTLKGIDIPKKLVQERETDLHTSFGVAFTLELILSGAFLVIVLALAPILAAVFHRPELWLLITVLGASIFSSAFVDLPAALPYREMRFLRWNLLTLIGPVVSFSVTIPLAFLGAGVWSLVAGTMAGLLVSGVALAVVSPVRPHLAWDRPLVRRYLTFGWPVWLGAVLAMAAGWGTVLTVSAVIGVAGLGYFELAQTWAGLALQVDGVLSDTVFPALCTVQSSVDRLRVAFVITNRLSMLWASPVGFALFTFAAPATRLLLGPKWHPAVFLLQAEGAGVVCSAVAYNWHLFFAARGQTRPQLRVSLLGVGWLIVVVIPLLVLFKIRGAGLAIVVLAAGSYLVRQHYVRQLLGPVRLLRVVWREASIGAAAAALIGILRVLGWKPGSAAGTVAQMAVYLACVAVIATITSRRLLRETLHAVLTRAASVPEDPGPATPTGRRLTPTPRRAAFPLLVARDPSGDRIWVTTRDWPALGRLDLASDTWSWTELPPFPHAPSPDGEGGCWTALTRSSALAHVDPSGEVRIVPLGRSSELLVSAVCAGRVWAVDAGNLLLWCVAPGGEATSQRLPPPFVRPDFVVADGGGAVWVADTQSCALGRVDVPGARIEVIDGPHPSRAACADPVRGGVWLGASDRPAVTLIDRRGAPLRSVELPGIPFGFDLAPDGRLVLALKDGDALAVVNPDTADVDVISLPEASMPMGCAVAGLRVFVTLAAASEVAELALPAASPSVPAAT